MEGQRQGLPVELDGGEGWRLDLTLDQIARLKKLSGPQAAARRIETVLCKLRALMSGTEEKGQG